MVLDKETVDLRYVEQLADSEQTAALLANDNIAVRAGLHCAPSAHKTYGTLREGTVRIAPSIFTKKQDVNLLLTSVVKIAKNS